MPLVRTAGEGETWRRVGVYGYDVECEDVAIGIILCPCPRIDECMCNATQRVSIRRMGMGSRHGMDGCDIQTSYCTYVHIYIEPLALTPFSCR